MNKEKIILLLIIFRMLTACIFAGGAVFLAYYNANGWGWCVFASILLGCVTYNDDEKESK